MTENYILELIETLPQLDGLEKSFHSFYVCTAVRKFFFFLDPLRSGKIRIQDVLACSFLDDLLELRYRQLLFLPVGKQNKLHSVQESNTSGIEGYINWKYAPWVGGRGRR